MHLGRQRADCARFNPTQVFSLITCRVIARPNKAGRDNEYDKQDQSRQ
jgi:hypothetical protein